MDVELLHEAAGAVLDGGAVEIVGVDCAPYEPCVLVRIPGRDTVEAPLSQWKDILLGEAFGLVSDHALHVEGMIAGYRAGVVPGHETVPMVVCGQPWDLVAADHNGQDGVKFYRVEELHQTPFRHKNKVRFEWRPASEE
jgi:hypothetical protein